MENSDEVLKAIDSTSLAVSTDSLDISFGEIWSMYEGKELEISPDYQRLFRWNLTQQSQLIESLLLGLPIPPIFVIETEARRYELIDGLQRISTYLHFIGKLLNHPKYKDDEKLKLIDCEIVKELNGLTIDELSPSLRIKLKRSYVKMYIIKKESPSRIKYDMFKRLNTGGSLLEAQEIRNSTIRFLGKDFIDFIRGLSGNLDFKQTIKYVYPYQIERQFDHELVLRFFTLKNGNLSGYKKENADYTLADYLTKFAEDISSCSSPFDYKQETIIFEKTFRFINLALGENAFSGKTKNFYAFYYEAISIAVSSMLDVLNEESVEILKERIIRLKDDEQFLDFCSNETHKRTNGKDYLKFLFKRIEVSKKIIGDL